MSSRLPADTADPGPFVDFSNDALIDSLIDKAGKPLVKDREAFRLALAETLGEYWARRDVGPKAMNRRVPRFLDLLDTAKRMVGLLEKDDGDVQRVQIVWEEKGKGFPPLRPQIELLIEILENEKKNLQKTEYHRSPRAHLIGKLAEVYADYFGEHAGASYKDGTKDAYGPFVRFAMAFCRLDPELDCAPNTIRDDLKRRDRRKGAKLLKK
jgi:hypothetical protein